MLALKLKASCRQENINASSSVCLITPVTCFVMYRKPAFYQKLLHLSCISSKQSAGKECTRKLPELVRQLMHMANHREFFQQKDISQRMAS
jgi:hypothetical protein